MRIFFGLILFLLCGLGISFVVYNNTMDESIISMEALDPEWQEQEMDAASFASNWLTDLDNEEYAVVANAYEPFEDVPDKAALQEKFKELRVECGEFFSRTYIESRVFAVANDDSEYRARVRYTTEFKNKTVQEVVEILVVGSNTPRVTDYRLEAVNETDKETDF